MDEKNFTLDEIKESLDEFMGQASAAAAPALERFAELQGQRAARLDSARERLKAGLGEDHPQVAALGEAAALADSLRSSLRATSVRESRRPRVGPHEWVVFGRVLDAKGEPAVGARVRVFDRDRKYDDLLGATETDEHGDFAAVYHERDLAEMGEGSPEMYLLVEDRQGNLLHSSREAVVYNAGRAEYFEVTLGEGPGGQTRVPAKSKRPPRKGRPAKRTAKR